MGELVPFIGLAPFLLAGFAIWNRSQTRMAEARVNTTAELSAEKAAQYASRVSELEDRVRVLERIVTDRGYDIATQIEALRDQRRVDGLDSGVSIDALRKERA